MAIVKKEFNRNSRILNEYLQNGEISAEAIAMDEAIRKHADGTPCHAKSPDSCPFNQKAEAGERLEKNADYYKNGLELNKEQLKETRRRLDLSESVMDAVQVILTDIGRKDPRVEKCLLGG